MDYVEQNNLGNDEILISIDLLRGFMAYVACYGNHVPLENDDYRIMASALNQSCDILESHGQDVFPYRERAIEFRDKYENED